MVGAISLTLVGAIPLTPVGATSLRWSVRSLWTLGLFDCRCDPASIVGAMWLRLSVPLHRCSLVGSAVVAAGFSRLFRSRFGALAPTTDSGVVPTNDSRIA